MHICYTDTKTQGDTMKKMPKSSCGYPGCDGIHIPNEETAKVLRDSEKGLNIESHASIEDFWKSMGMKPNA